MENMKIHRLICAFLSIHLCQYFEGHVQRFCLHRENGNDPYLANGLGRRPDIFIHTETTENWDHPCAKPIGFWKKLLLRGSVRESDIVLDPFMGSGTTLRAAKDLGRRAIGIEIEEKYCEIAAKRLSQKVLDFGT
jgi:DNA modification methylase